MKFQPLDRLDNITPQILLISLRISSSTMVADRGADHDAHNANAHVDAEPRQQPAADESAPRMPTTMSPIRPIPPPLTSVLASQPATAPTTKPNKKCFTLHDVLPRSCTEAMAYRVE